MCVNELDARSQRIVGLSPRAAWGERTPALPQLMLSLTICATNIETATVIS
jgi:hypothetical protein